MVGGGCWPTAMQNCWMFVNWPCIAAMLVAWDFIDSCMAAYAAPKFAKDSLYDAIDASSSMVAMKYPFCEAGAAVWLTSAMASTQYSLKELLILTIGGLSISCAIQFLYSSEYIPHRLMTRRPMSMMSHCPSGNVLHLCRMHR